MTLEDFEQILSMKTEIQVIEKRMQNRRKDKYVGDTAKDYSKGHERIITIRGYAISNTEETDRTLNKYKEHQKVLHQKVLQAEHFILSIPDSRVRTLLTLRFLEGESWESAAKKFYKKMTADSARKCVERFFEKN